MGLFKTSYGSFFYKNLPFGFFLGMFTKFIYFLSNIYYIDFFSIYLYFLNTKIFFIYNYSFFAKSPGTFCKIFYFNNESYFCFLLLPSKKRITISIFNLINVGRNNNMFHKHQYFSKNNKIFFKKPKVRGICMNSCDHPNGGRSNTKGSLKNI